MAPKPKRKQKRNDTCLYRGEDQSEDPLGPDTGKICWLCCDSCNHWTHLDCFETATSTLGSVTSELFRFIDSDVNIVAHWKFTCSKCSGISQSIPDQLETQSLMYWQHLVDLGVNQDFITKGAPPSFMEAAGTSTGAVPNTSTTSDTAAVAPFTGSSEVSVKVPLASIATPPSASNPPIGDLQMIIGFFKQLEDKREQERKEETDRRERERKEREEERKELERKRENDRMEMQDLFLKLINSKDEELRNLEKSRIDTEKTSKAEQLKFEKERFEKEQELERKRLEQEAELEKLRIQKEEDMKAEQMKMEERRDDHLTHLFGQLQTGEHIPTPSSDRQRIGLKLPFVKIPNFNGDVLKWMEFWDMFSATVHDNPDLSPVQKLSYLKASLEGPARESISQLAMVNDKYKVAVDLLKKRYGNMEIIEEKLFAKLQNLPTSSMRLEDLRHTFHTVEQSLEQLKNLDDNFGSGSCEGHFLVNMVKKKFPPKIVVEIEKEQTKSWGLKDLMNKLEQVISIYQREADLKAEIYGQKVTGSSPQFSQPTSKGNISPVSTFKRKFFIET